MNGFTPFGGIIEKVTPSQASPSMGNAAIRRNEYSFRPGYKPMSPAVPSLDVFPKELADLFTRAFLVTGSINPKLRPTSTEWHQALSRYEAAIIDCPASNGVHQYDRKNQKCPFCEADRRYQKSIGGQNAQPLTSNPQSVKPSQWKPP
jgi:DNA-binding helix-hairpin-helix protein with protein kinase domain